MDIFKKLNFQYAKQSDTLFIIDTNYFLYAYQSYFLSGKFVEALKSQDIYIPFVVFIEFINNIDKTITETSSGIKSTMAHINNIKTDEIFEADNIRRQIKNQLFNTKAMNSMKDFKFKKEVEQEILDLVQNISEEIEVNVNSINEKIKSEAEKFKFKNEDRFSYKNYKKNLEKLNTEFNNIFNESLGKEYTSEDIINFISDMDYRFENKIPPGFKDASKTNKEDGSRKLTFYGDLKFESKAGDLIFWKDLINYINKSEKEFENIVIVTDDSKEDWKFEKGSDKVHKLLKIEFLEKTNKPLDIITVGDFINNSSLDEESKILINKEISKKKIVFTIDNYRQGTDTQAHMMKYVFEKVINEYPVNINDLLNLPCLSTKEQLKNNASAIFDRTYVLDIKLDYDIVLGTRLNIYDKLNNIKKLFAMANINMNFLSFEHEEYQVLWESMMA